MKLSTRFRKLNIWNKFFVITGLLTVLGLVLTVLFYYFPYATPPNTPALPLISLQTVEGYTINDFTGNPVDAERVRYLKEHSFVIQNTGAVTLLNIDIRIRLPEPVVCNLPVIHPPGIEAVWGPLLDLEYTASPSAGLVENKGIFPVVPHFKYHFQVSSLPPSKSVEVRFLTSNDPRLGYLYWIHDNFTSGGQNTFDLNAAVATNILLSGIMPGDRPKNGTSSQFNFLKGTYQYGYLDQLREGKVFAPVLIDRNRRLSIYGIYNSAEGFSIIEYIGEP